MKNTKVILGQASCVLKCGWLVKMAFDTGIGGPMQGCRQGGGGGGGGVRG